MYRCTCLCLIIIVKRFLCNCVQHRNDLNVFCDGITNALIDSASCTIPNRRAKDK